MKRYIPLLLSVFCFLNQSCQITENKLTEAQIQEITKSATDVVKEVFEYSNNMDFEAGLIHYSEADNSYFITDGIIHSLNDLRKSYRAIGPQVEVLHNTIESWNTKVLSKDVVTFTLPVRLTLKLKGIPEYTGKLIWTATVQKQNDKWMIVQSHESWLNCAEVTAALTPTTHE
ncbi:hypothetical protein ATO12_17800 [Aquimarina atlantica]|uniref:Uncharacterized protein n=1 Tax=Aquimarina atlantica TaxID=1317122 RepID=A0A023BUS6_9FLAO|nr:nuclear transport factor 2 family protein [Aquimarina atlantica]EZH73787.1 hypothetical protein ATO12_17800 [Aquimarina atlantica]